VLSLRIFIRRVVLQKLMAKKLRRMTSSIVADVIYRNIFFFECKALLCDYCELADHKSDACQMLNAPKPQVIMYGHADEKLVFFEFPTTQTYRPKLESSRNGLLSVSGGGLTIPQIVAQLK
jgi:hypothetical protein